MLLPGVSGSRALLVLGLEPRVAGAVHARDSRTTGGFAVGVALGAAAVTPSLRWLLPRWHDRTIGSAPGSWPAAWWR